MTNTNIKNILSVQNFGPTNLIRNLLELTLLVTVTPDLIWPGFNSIALHDFVSLPPLSATVVTSGFAVVAASADLHPPRSPLHLNLPFSFLLQITSKIDYNNEKVSSRYLFGLLRDKTIFTSSLAHISVAFWTLGILIFVSFDCGTFWKVGGWSHAKQNWKFIYLSHPGTAC